VPFLRACSARLRRRQGEAEKTNSENCAPKLQILESDRPLFGRKNYKLTGIRKRKAVFRNTFEAGHDWLHLSIQTYRVVAGAVGFADLA